MARMSNRGLLRRLAAQRVFKRVAVDNRIRGFWTRPTKRTFKPLTSVDYSHR